MSKKEKFVEFKMPINTEVDCIDLTGPNADDSDDEATIINEKPKIKSEFAPPITQVFPPAPPMTQFSQPLLDDNDSVQHSQPLLDDIDSDSSLNKKPKARVLFVDDAPPSKPPQKRKGKKAEPKKKPSKPFASSTPSLQTKLSLFPVDLPPRRVTPRSLQKRRCEDGGVDDFLRRLIAEAKQKKEEAKKKAWSVELQTRTALSFGLCK